MSAAPTDSWLRKALREIPILVLGILIAFGLQAWWDGVRASDDEYQALQAARSELQLNLEGLELNIERHDRVVAAVEVFHAAMVEFESALISDSILVAAVVSPTYDPATGALESLQRLGLGSAALAEASGRWRSEVDDATEDEQRSRTFTDEQLSPYLARNVDLPNADLSRLWVFKLLEAPIETSTRVTSTSELRFLLSTRLKWARLNSQELRQAKDETHALLQILDETLR